MKINLGMPFPHIHPTGLISLLLTNRNVQLMIFSTLATLSLLWVRFPAVAPPIIRSTLLSVRSPAVRNIMAFSFVFSVLARRAFPKWKRRTFFPVFTLLMWALFYRFKVVESPVVRFRRNYWNVHISERAQLSKKRFHPTPWAFTRHAQTITCFLACQLEWQWQPQLQFDREEITASDNNTLFIDWAYFSVEDESKWGLAHIPRVFSRQNINHSNDSPIVLAVHGLGDDRTHPYIRRLVRACSACGMRVAVHSYWRVDFKNSSDLARVVHHIAVNNPNAPIVAIGYSAGGFILLRYLQEAGKNTELAAAMVVSPCLDFVQAVHDVEENENVTYRLFLDNQTRLCVWRHLENDRTIQHRRKEFEAVIHHYGNHCLQLYDRFIHELGNYTDKDPSAQEGGYEFMKQTAAHYKHPPADNMHKIQVTTLVLSALDDPVVHMRNIDWSRFCENENIIVMRTKRGGHVGWYENFLPFGDTLVERTFIDYVSAVLDSHSHTNFLLRVIGNAQNSGSNSRPGSSNSFGNLRNMDSWTRGGGLGVDKKLLIRPQSIARLCAWSGDSDSTKKF